MNLRNKKLFFWACWLLFLTFGEARAQQDVQLSQYMFNTLSFNPAYAGSANLLSASALYRAQWVNFKGAPSTQILTANSPLRNKRLAVGGSLYADAIGNAQTFGVYGDFAYIILFDKTQLAFGVKAGFDIYQNRYTDLVVTDPDDPKYSQDVRGKFLPNVGFGVYYYSDVFYVGLSSPAFIKNSFTKKDNNGDSDNRQEIETYFTAGYALVINDNITFRPTLLFKFVNNAPATADINASFLFVQRFWIGFMYRWGSSWGGMLQFNITPKLRFGYSIDFATSQLQNYNSGTHEFMISYDFADLRRKFTSPRYF